LAAWQSNTMAFGSSPPIGFIGIELWQILFYGRITACEFVQAAFSGAQPIVVRFRRFGPGGTESHPGVSSARK
jgi:hypothetical protein